MCISPEAAASGAARCSTRQSSARHRGETDMLFPTLTFGLFFLAVYSGAWLLRGSNEWRKIALLIASWIFYGWWDTRFVLLLIASAFLNWGAARLIVAADD